MTAVVLAAGIGRRMQPLTCDTPKTLLPVAGKPVINWIIDALLEKGILQITIVTGYRAAELRAHLGRAYPQLALHYLHNERYAETNNICSLALAVEHLPPDDIVLIESDLVFEPAVLDRLLTSPHENVALVGHYRLGMDGTVVTLDGDTVVSVVPPHLQGASFDYGGTFKTLNIYRFSRAFCAGDFRKLLTHYAAVVDDKCYYELILGILIYLQRAVIHAEVLTGEHWAEIDDPNDLTVAEYEFAPHRRREILETSHGSYWNFDVLDFCYLRNPCFPTGALYSELRNHLQTLVENYGSCQTDVDRKLAYFLQCRPDRVVALNGASQAFPPLAVYLSGRRVLIPAPSFLEYARLFPDAATYGDTVGFDVDEIEASATHADVIVFVSPNNPTGSVVPSSWIEAFARRHPQRTVVVDESFGDFSGDRSMVARLEESPCENVVVVKSLSKALGMPGVRLGFLYSSCRAVTAAIRQGLPVWNLNSLAEFVLESVIKHRPELEESFVQTVGAREGLARGLRALPGVAQVFPSRANFLLVRLDRGHVNQVDVVDHLLQVYGIYVKDVSDRFRDGGVYVRVAVRQHQDNARLLSALGATLMA